MTKSTSATSSSGVGLTGLLFLLFLTLKLTGIGPVAMWSWWWITAPLWIPPILIIGIFLAYLVLIAMFSKLF